MIVVWLLGGVVLAGAVFYAIGLALIVLRIGI